MSGIECPVWINVQVNRNCLPLNIPFGSMCIRVEEVYSHCDTAEYDVQVEVQPEIIAGSVTHKKKKKLNQLQLSYCLISQLAWRSKQLVFIRMQRLTCVASVQRNVLYVASVEVDYVAWLTIVIVTGIHFLLCPFLHAYHFIFLFPSLCTQSTEVDVHCFTSRTN